MFQTNKASLIQVIDHDDCGVSTHIKFDTLHCTDWPDRACLNPGKRLRKSLHAEQFQLGIAKTLDSSFGQVSVPAAAARMPNLMWTPLYTLSKLGFWPPWSEQEGISQLNECAINISLSHQYE